LLTPPVAVPGWAAVDPGTGPSITTRLAAAHLAEPLVKTAPTTQGEDRALLQAVAAYEHRTDNDDFTSLTRFLSAHPHSGWRPAVLTNLGLLYLRYGYFSRAISAWEEAWREGKSATELRARALVDLAVGELVQLHSQLGNAERLAALLDELRERRVTGSATEMVQIAAEARSIMQQDTKHLFLCGPMALKSLMLAQGAGFEQVNFLNRYRAGPRGTSLAEVAHLAEEAKLPYRLVFRKAGQAVPVPSVVHWKVGHFAAIVGEANGRFRVVDPAFGFREFSDRDNGPRCRDQRLFSCSGE
jgi:hypothetical protein